MIVRVSQRTQKDMELSRLDGIAERQDAIDRRRRETGWVRVCRRRGADREFYWVVAS